MAKAAASTINWLPIGITVLATIIVAAVGFLAIQHDNLSNQHYDLNRDVGEVDGKMEGLADSIKRVEDNQIALTTTVGEIGTTVDGLEIAMQQLISFTCDTPPCEITPILVLTIDDLLQSTPDQFVFDVTLPTESSPILVNESSIEVNETVYNASWVRMNRDPEEMNIVPWTITLGPFQTHAHRQQVDAALKNQGIPVFWNLQQQED